MGSPSPLFYGVICYNRTTVVVPTQVLQKRWFPRPRFVRSRSAGSPLTVMYKWCQPSRLQYGSRATKSRANGLVRELFFQFGIFARETVQSCIANVCIVMYRKRVYNVCQDLRMHQASGIKFLVKFSDTAAPQIVSDLKFRIQVSDLNETRQLKVSDPNS